VQNSSQLLILERLNAGNLLTGTAIGEATATSFTQNMLVVSREKIWSDGCMMSIPTTKLLRRNARKQLRKVVLFVLEVDHEKKSAIHVEMTSQEMRIAIIETEIIEEITGELMMTGVEQKIQNHTIDEMTTIIMVRAIVEVGMATRIDAKIEDTKRMLHHMSIHLHVTMMKAS
jgi:hypothetical protein